MLIAALRQHQIDMVKQAIIKKWQIKDNSLVMEFLKIKIMCNRKDQTINLDQQAYIKEIIDEWIQPNEKTWTLMTTTSGKAPADMITPDNIRCRYPILVGKLLWVSNTVCPNICYAINTLARHMSRPMEEAMQAVLHVIKYLNQTRDEVL